MKFLSYNLLKHKAIGEVDFLSLIHAPDVMCLQEVDTSKFPKYIGNLELAIATEKNRLGLAVYVNTASYRIEEVAAFQLKGGNYDRIASPAHERLLGVHISDRSGSEAFTVGSFHASPLTALNSVRRGQIKQSLKSLTELGDGSPVMMLGDFNYPIFRKKLEAEVKSLGYQLLTSNEQTYRNKLVRGYFDFAVHQGFSVKSLKTLRQGASDHLPILAEATLS